MNIVLRVIIDIFILGGCFFALAGAVGIVRMPDTFSRMQSSTNITTLGVLLTLIGALLYCIFVMHSWGSAAKVVVIGVLTVLANPVGGHAIARAAYRIGIRPQRELVIDDLADPEACAEPETEAEGGQPAGQRDVGVSTHSTSHRPAGCPSSADHLRLRAQSPSAFKKTKKWYYSAKVL